MPADLSLCYTCGQEEPTHHPMCPDEKWNLKMSRLYHDLIVMENLIPIGTYYYDFMDGGRLRRDIEARHGY